MATIKTLSIFFPSTRKHLRPSHSLPWSHEKHWLSLPFIWWLPFPDFTKCLDFCSLLLFSGVLCKSETTYSPSMNWDLNLWKTRFGGEFKFLHRLETSLVNQSAFVDSASYLPILSTQLRSWSQFCCPFKSMKN